MRQLSFALCSCLLIACGGSKSGGGGNNGTDAANADAPELVGDKYTVTWGPLTVAPGGENTQCIWLRLPNTTEIKVHSLHNQLTDGSHHMIVYKDDMDATEQTTRVDCQPFTGALNTSGMIAPIAITQRSDDPIFLPNGVAYTFAPHQMIKLEMHYKNSGDTDLAVMGTVDFYAADPATIQNEAAILFAGSPDIDIPAGQTVTLHQFFKPTASANFSNAKFFAITGHTHGLGTQVKVRTGASAAGPMTEVYAPSPFRWDEPATATGPEFTLPAGGGFDFECTWKNTTTATVKFGESADKEMCFFWAYYYPSIGSKVCFHTANFNGVDVCCPGDGLCSYIQNML